jgi:hypothetical protein
MKLLLDGRQMSDDKTASEYKLQEGATLHMILPLYMKPRESVEGLQ